MAITHQVHTGTGRIHNFASMLAAVDFAEALRGEGSKTVGRFYPATPEREAVFYGSWTTFDTQAEADIFAAEMRQSEGMGF